jgi:hypothetical protein
MVISTVGIKTGKNSQTHQYLGYIQLIAMQAAFAITNKARTTHLVHLKRFFPIMRTTFSSSTE